jgi:Outer membrane lipoprotein-sorting protein
MAMFRGRGLGAGGWLNDAGRRCLVLVVSFVVTFPVWLPASAADGPPSNPARELLDQVRQMNQTTRAWKDRTQRLDVTIIDRKKNERRREMSVVTKKYADEKTRTLLFFLSPADVRGVGLLQWSAPHEEDTQWLRLPSLDRLRRISGSSKRESFVGTDFSFEDLSVWSDILDWSEQDARATLLKSEVLEGQECAVIEMVPTGKEVSYDKIRLWLGRQDLVIHRMEFEDDGRIEKTLDLSDVRPVGSIPVAHRLEMHDVRGGSSTIVVFTQIEYDQGVADEELTQRRLEKGI